MRRREFLSLAASASTSIGLSSNYAYPQIAAKRIIAVYAASPDDPEYLRFSDTLARALVNNGWKLGSELFLTVKWGDPRSIQSVAIEAIAALPDVLVTGNLPTALILSKLTQTIPIVFASGGDPVKGGLVQSLRRPGGNVTGFSATEPSLAGKWFQLVSMLAPKGSAFLVIAAPENPINDDYLKVISDQAATEKKHLTIVSAEQMDEALRIPHGMIVLPGSSNTLFRRKILQFARENRLPGVYAFRSWSDGGGTISYGPDQSELFRRVGGYVSRILRGERPAELPVEQPAKYDLIINARVAKEDGIVVPADLLAAADEVIE